MSEPVFQSSLGTVHNNSSRAGKTWNDGALNMGRVTRMHHKRATADTQVLGGPNEIRSREEQEGRNGPVLCSRYAGFDPKLKKPYGEFIPLQKNDRPLFVYAENDKSKPFIVGMLHHTDENVGKKNRKDILPSDYPVDPENSKEALREIYIHRTQDAFTRDGNGEIEASSHTKAFFKTWDDIHEDEEIDEEAFDYENLHLKDKGRPVREDHDESYRGDANDPEIEDLGNAEYDETKTIFLPEDLSRPLKYLGVIRNRYKDAETDYLRFFIDASDLSAKINRQQKQDDKSTNWQMKEDGAVVFRRQTDAYKTGEGKKYTQVEIKEDGDVTVQNRVAENENNFARVGSDHIRIRRQLDSNELNSGSRYTYVEIDANGTFRAENHTGEEPGLFEMSQSRISMSIGSSFIVMTPDSITINAPTVHIN